GAPAPSGSALRGCNPRGCCNTSVIASEALKRARRRRLNRLLTVCATLVIGTAIAVVWVRVVQTLTESSHPLRVTAPPGGLVWNHRVFTSSAQFKAYLTSRGYSYSRWIANHPG